MKSYLPSYKRITKELYQGHAIEVVFYGPDYGVQVDGDSFNSFFVSTDAALTNAKQYINALEDEK